MKDTKKELEQLQTKAETAWTLLHEILDSDYLRKEFDEDLFRHLHTACINLSWISREIQKDIEKIPW